MDSEDSKVRTGRLRLAVATSLAVVCAAALLIGSAGVGGAPTSPVDSDGDGGGTLCDATPVPEPDPLAEPLAGLLGLIGVGRTGRTEGAEQRVRSMNPWRSRRSCHGA